MLFNVFFTKILQQHTYYLTQFFEIVIEFQVMRFLLILITNFWTHKKNASRLRGIFEYYNVAII